MSNSKGRIYWALVTPMANEAKNFDEFINSVKKVLNKLGTGKVYMVLDKVSKDGTLELAKDLEKIDNRFEVVWAPENKNVVDAYLAGFKEACKYDYEYIIEIDAGLSHNPETIPEFLKYLEQGYDIVYGSRFMKKNSINTSVKRLFFSKMGTYASNILLGTSLTDATSGYEGFKTDVLKKLLSYKLLSTGHFYQTEVKYLLKDFSYIEIPITYRFPSNSVSRKTIYNSIEVLFYYFFKRLVRKHK